MDHWTDDAQKSASDDMTDAEYGESAVPCGAEDESGVEFIGQSEDPPFIEFEDEADDPPFIEPSDEVEEPPQVELTDSFKE